MSTVARFRQSRLQFPVIFLGCLSILMVLYYALPGFLIESVLVRFFAVVPGAHLLDWLTPHHPVAADHTRIVSPLARLNVLKGCEGIEALLILYAALLAAMRPIIKTFWGLLLGTLLVFLLNQLRIVALFFIAAYDKSLFEPVHGFVAPILIIAAAGGFFLLWLNWTLPAKISP